MTFKERVGRWWEGEGKVIPGESGPGWGIGPSFYTEYHWTARAARAVVAFYVRYWQWVWSTIIGCAALYVAVLSIPK